MTPGSALLSRILQAPPDALALSELEWDLLIRLARRSSLLAELGWRLRDAGVLGPVLPQARSHLVAAMAVVQQQHVAVRHEIDQVMRALRGSGVPVTFLKGAGYVVATLPMARARVFSDLDILVPKTRLQEVEGLLRIHGWQFGEMSPYDQRYYRQWMHELPPMTHVRRGSVVDVHHTILPETARLKVDARALLDGISAIDESSGVHVLQPTDMVLHSTTHLFHDAEFDNALRDLFDLDAMLRHFGRQESASTFWTKLVPRAQALGLTRPLFYALRYTQALLKTPLPAALISEADIGRPPSAVLWLMDACYMRALQPVHASAGGIDASAARGALYLRSHWMRMPAHLLILHLGRKALTRALQRPVEAPPAHAADR